MNHRSRSTPPALARVRRGLPSDGSNEFGFRPQSGSGFRLRLEHLAAFVLAGLEVGHVARLFSDAGVVALVPLISPYRADRDHVRALHAEAGVPFIEVFVDTPIELCEQLDPKGLYAKARAGEITGFTGIDDPYEAPLAPELVLTPAHGDAPQMATLVLALVG